MFCAIPLPLHTPANIHERQTAEPSTSTAHTLRLMLANSVDTTGPFQNSPLSFTPCSTSLTTPHVAWIRQHRKQPAAPASMHSRALGTASTTSACAATSRCRRAIPPVYTPPSALRSRRTPPPTHSPAALTVHVQALLQPLTRAPGAAGPWQRREPPLCPPPPESSPEATTTLQPCSPPSAVHSRGRTSERNRQPRQRATCLAPLPGAHAWQCDSAV